MMRYPSKKTVILLATLILVSAFFLALFHFHADGGAHHDCPVCRLVQAFGFLFAFAWIAFVSAQAKAQRFVPVAVPSRKSFFLASKLRDRAPPFLK